MGKSKDLATSSLSSDLTVDTNTFHVDVADNRVGIGTTTPTNNLTIIDGGATPYGADDTVLLDIKRNTANTGATNAVGFRLANNSNGFNIKYGGASDTLNISGGSGNTVATFRNDGGLTLSYQPFFQAYTTVSVDITTQATIVYNATSINRGSHYNTSNGRFTAPVAGVYSFGVYHWHKINTSGTVYLEFFKNSSTVVGEYRNTRGSSHSEYNRVGFHHEMYLNANDYITVRAKGDGGGQLHTSSGSAYSYFSGYLLG